MSVTAWQVLHNRFNTINQVKTMKLTGEILVENMSDAEKKRAEVVESVLPVLREKAMEVDRSGEFYMPHVKTLSDAGLLGLMVP